MTHGAKQAVDKQLQVGDGSEEQHPGLCLQMSWTGLHMEFHESLHLPRRQEELYFKRTNSHTDCGQIAYPELHSKNLAGLEGKVSLPGLRTCSQQG